MSLARLGAQYALGARGPRPAASVDVARLGSLHGLTLTPSELRRASALFSFGSGATRRLLRPPPTQLHERSRSICN